SSDVCSSDLVNLLEADIVAVEAQDRAALLDEKLVDGREVNILRGDAEVQEVLAVAEEQARELDEERLPALDEVDAALTRSAVLLHVPAVRSRQDVHPGFVKNMIVEDIIRFVVSDVCVAGLSHVLHQVEDYYG